MCETPPSNGAKSDLEIPQGNSSNIEEDEELKLQQPAEERTRTQRFLSCLSHFYFTNEFLVLVVIAILVAKAYPPLGAIYLAPDITATWIAVELLFFLAGLSLKTKEFAYALKQIYFNGFVQLFNFGVASSIVFGISRLLILGNVLSTDLADGLVVCASLPMTINMVLVLTQAGGGDEAAALFNSAFGNFVGIFVSPLLILGYLGVSGSVNIVDTFYKLALRVILPVVVGQLLQKCSKRLNDFATKHKKALAKAQMYMLVFIVYTVFCTTFLSESTSTIGDIFITIAFVFISLVLLMILAWYSLKLLFRNQPKLRVMGFYGCTQKTVALGVPLIKAIYGSDPAIGLYTLPLLIWHPMQLVLGSLLAPRLKAFVEREEQRLGLSSSSQGTADATTTDDRPTHVQAASLYSANYNPDVSESSQALESEREDVDAIEVQAASDR